LTSKVFNFVHARTCAQVRQILRAPARMRAHLHAGARTQNLKKFYFPKIIEV
jgi:hypothetical protein